MIRAAVVGAAGYTGGELVRLLLQHPRVSELTCISASQAGQAISQVHRDLFWSSLHFAAALDPQGVDVIFICGAHGDAQKLIERHGLDTCTALLIDLSQDFRLPRPEHNFVYGLPEAFAAQLRVARRIANPGCFATAIQLALLPLAEAQLLQKPIHITALTGSTGAGQKLQESSHFSWRSQNVSVYKAFEHQHLAEIEHTLGRLQPDFGAELVFVPMRGNFTRGILASLYTESSLSQAEAEQLFDHYYKDSSFVHRSPQEIDLKQVVNTNHALLSVRKHGPYLHIVSCLDNLLKGAAGQAVQNMNLFFDRPETEGLWLKPLAF